MADTDSDENEGVRFSRRRLLMKLKMHSEARARRAQVQVEEQKQEQVPGPTLRRLSTKEKMENVKAALNRSHQLNCWSSDSDPDQIPGPSSGHLPIQIQVKMENGNSNRKPISKNPERSMTETVDSISIEQKQKQQKLAKITLELKKTLNIRTEKVAQNGQVDCVRSLVDDSDSNEKIPGPLFQFSPLRPVSPEEKMEKINLLNCHMMTNDDDDDNQFPETSPVHLPIPMASNQDQQFGSYRLQSFMESIKAVEAAKKASEASLNTVTPAPISTMIPAFPTTATSTASSTLSDLSSDILGEGFLFAEKEFKYIRKLQVQGLINYDFDCENNRIVLDLQSSSKSPYYNRIIQVELQIDPDNYPKIPLTVKFLNKMYHPFVEDKTGLVGLRDLNLTPRKWELNGSICFICLSILRILDNPRWEGGLVLNKKAHRVLRKDAEKFFQMAKSYGVSA